MSKERELSGRVRSWLREDGHENADRVLDTVLDQLDATPQRHANWLARRFPIMKSNGVRFGIGAAAVVIVAILGLRFFGPVNNAGQPDVTPTPSPASGLAQNGKIVVTDGKVLRAFEPDGSGMTVLDTLPGPILSVVVSPDGTRVAYPYENGGHQGLRVLALATGESTDLQVPDHVGGEPVSWSPDGQSITFAGLGGDVEHVYIADADGTSLRTVGADAIDSNLEIVTPVWSPDGQWLAFVGRPPGSEQGRMYVIHPDGSELHQLDTARVLVGDGGYISWAPDPSAQRLLYLVDASPGLAIRLFDVATGQDYRTGLAFWPSWSPDGKKIGACCVSIVQTADVIAGNLQPMTVFTQFDGNCPDAADVTGLAICSTATWSPDGSMLIAADVVDSLLVMAPADGSGAPVTIDLTTAKTGDVHIAWQPIRP